MNLFNRLVTNNLGTRTPSQRQAGYNSALEQHLQPLPKESAVNLRAGVILSVWFVGWIIQQPIRAAEPLWQAGAAKRIVTPTEPMWMAGYGGRTAPSTGKLSELYAKALVLEDAQSQRGVILSLDLVGIDRVLALRIRRAIGEKLQCPPDNVWIATSHTHSGPVVGKNLWALHYDQLNEHYRQQIDTYAEQLLAHCVAVAEEAKTQLAPATVSWGSGHTDFATNRRTNKEAQVPEQRTSKALAGPVSHDVPVLAVRRPSGQLHAVLFGYACHSTVLSGNQWSADYPGYAQEELERRYPQAIALFFAGCGADQNPLPRRTVELAKHYGQRLANAVDSVLLTTKMRVATSELNCRYGEVALPLGPLPTLEELKRQQASSNKSEATRAELLLTQIAQGSPLSPTYPYPVSVWQIGNGPKLVALGGEVVVDYALRIQAEVGENTWIAGYSHDVMAYIPSRRVLTEGGYEGGGAMVYYGLPTVWAPEVEEVIMSEVHRVGQTRRP